MWIVEPVAGATVGVAALWLSFRRSHNRPSLGQYGLLWGVTTLVAISLGVPQSLSEFNTRNRRIGVANRLEAARQVHVSCLSGIHCDRVELRRDINMGCFAVRGEVDKDWLYPCEIPISLIELSKPNGLVVATFGSTATESDFWLLTERGTFEVLEVASPAVQR